jgi:hypothetical protein
VVIVRGRVWKIRKAILLVVVLVLGVLKLSQNPKNL